MRYFVLFEDDGDSLIQKIGSYHQFYEVREAVRVTTIAATDPEGGAVREQLGGYHVENLKEEQPAVSALPLTHAV